MPYLYEIARATNSQLLRGDKDLAIKGVNSLEDGTKEQLGFYIKNSYSSLLSNTLCGAIISSSELADQVIKKAPVSCAILSAEDSQKAYLSAMKLFEPKDSFIQGISSHAHIDKSAQIGKNVSIGTMSVIGSGCIIGDNSKIGNGVSIEEEVSIGRDCIIHSNVSIYSRNVLHDRVVIHSNSVIGADGFGYISWNKIHNKIPHCGSVLIEDDVEIGANSAVDRATMGTTRIGAGSKIDNLCQIGHNVVIGKRCIICSGSLIGGSARLGDDCILAGGSGVIDNIKLSDKTVICGGAVVVKNTRKGAHIHGLIGRDKRQYLREVSFIKKLPVLFKLLNTRANGKDKK